MKEVQTMRKYGGCQPVPVSRPELMFNSCDAQICSETRAYVWLHLCINRCRYLNASVLAGELGVPGWLWGRLLGAGTGGRSVFHSDFAVPHLIGSTAKSCPMSSVLIWLTCSTNWTLPGE